MLDAILKFAVPLKSHVDLPDPMGFGFIWRIFRMDATDYEEAERDLPVYLGYEKAVRTTATKAAARVMGSRRGKRGRLIKAGSEEEAEEPRLPVVELDDKLEIIAEYLAHPLEVPDGAFETWGAGETPGNLADSSLFFLSTVPADADGDPLCVPAGIRDGSFVLQISDLLDTDEEIPYGGFGAGYQPTINRVLAAWILEESDTPGNFSKTGELEDGIEAIRPTKGGSGSSSEPEAPKTDAP